MLDNILDLQDKVNAIDKDGMLKLCEKTPIFYKNALQLLRKVKVLHRNPENLVISGMGGSAIGGELLKDWLRDKVSIPIEVSKDYRLPAYVDEKSFVVVVSYSGETEETLSSFVDAVNRNCTILTISSGGSLESYSRKVKVPHIKVPGGLPPRAALPYTFFPLVVLMEKIGLVPSVEEEVEAALHILKQIRNENSLEVPVKKNYSKKLALKLSNTIPIIYGFGHYRAAALRMKCQLNENSKVPSKFEVFPEINHNEIVGWEEIEDLSNILSFIFIRDPEAPSVITERIKATLQFMSPKFSNIFELKTKGESKLAKILSVVYMGDFISIYLALLRNINPTLTKSITNLKKYMMEKSDVKERIEKEINRLKYQ